ncbi:creatininase family protein [Actinomadura graeca]|uniref:Creatininase family protein n=1 Tax=Actinomadura graeca TaxID=2750812 RepID=A0ABX8QV78_9ACTN|nr:creatininase family protein [Actinomadura graeca]QXJ22548.1 creatininase family protein [Actinomadura graeca]
MTANEPVLWSKLSTTEIRDAVQRAHATVIWPIGATEQHGPHLPVDVDHVLAASIAERVSARTGIPVLPTLPITSSWYWRGWPGTLSISAATLGAVLLEVCSGLAASGVRRLILLNAHGGNIPALMEFPDRASQAVPDLAVRVLHWWEASPRVTALANRDTAPGDGGYRVTHANVGETSLYMALDAGTVRLDRIDAEPDLDAVPRFYFRPTAEFSPNGVFGHPSGATPEQGRELLKIVIDDIVALTERAAAEMLADGA